MNISNSLTNRIFESIQDFQIQQYKQPLGVGSFGTVRLGVHKCTNKKYAIKIICMDQNFNQNQLSLLQRQISIHYSLHHPHIIQLWDVLYCQQKIYLIMQYASSGNLFNYQTQCQHFSQVESFKIFIQILQAIDYLHRNDIIHRDIKPENILIDGDGGVKLCDFGWAAHQIYKKRETFCGTYQYMAPEMINSHQYDYKIDIWALGILLFQLNHSYAPFQATNLQGMIQKVSAGSYQINTNISEQLKSLIIQILQFDSSLRPSIFQIKKHIWIERMKRFIQQNKLLQRISTKKLNRNIYGSLDTSAKKHVSKFSSMIFTQSVNKKEQICQAKFVGKDYIKKKSKKKCKTLQQASLQKLIKPTLQNLLTQKQNLQPHQLLPKPASKPIPLQFKNKNLTKTLNKQKHKSIHQSKIQLRYDKGLEVYLVDKSKVKRIFGNLRSQQRKNGNLLNLLQIKRKRKKIC